MADGAKAMDDFDTVWLTRWNILHQEGRLFRSLVNGWERRQMPGSLGLFAQYHPGFFDAKRKTAENSSVLAPPRVPVRKSFDPVAFNFTKVSAEEILLDGLCEEDELVCDLREKEAKGQVSLILNVSPQFPGHGLLVPNIADGLPQELTEQAVLAALQLLAQSKRPNLRIGYNSLGAFASVNHLHMHFWYFEEEHCSNGKLPVEMQRMRPVGDWREADGLVEAAELPGWPCHSLVLVASGPRPLQALARATERLVGRLLQTGVAHNLFFGPALRNVELGTFASSPRIFVWPRQNMAENIGPLQACTTLPGVAYCKDAEEFQSLDEASWAEEVRMNVSLSEQDFESLKHWWLDSGRREPSA